MEGGEPEGREELGSPAVPSSRPWIALHDPSAPPALSKNPPSKPGGLCFKLMSGTVSPAA
jgi:hypothetical protein